MSRLASVAMRTARSHTRRSFTPGRFVVACFVLLQLAPLIGVLSGMLSVDAYLTAVKIVGICGSAAFAMHAVWYWLVLSRARVDDNTG